MHSLSLGHPVKAPARQTEAYGYGAAAWLNDVDGVGYRIKASSEPLTPGKIGHSALSVVKDRYGDVRRHGIKTDDDKSDLPWYFMGSFYVDDTYTGQVMVGEKLWQHLKVTAPSKDGGDKLDKVRPARAAGHVIPGDPARLEFQVPERPGDEDACRWPGRAPHRHARHARTAAADGQPA
jgi:hypothetical protein